MLGALARCPPHQDWPGYLDLLELYRDTPPDPIERMVAVFAAHHRVGARDRWRTWLRAAVRVAGLPAADLHAVHERLAAVWRAPDTLQADTLDLLVALASLRGAFEDGTLDAPMSGYLFWLLDPNRPPHWTPEFADAVRAPAALAPAQVAAAVERVRPRAPVLAARLAVPLGAALRLVG